MNTQILSLLNRGSIGFFFLSVIVIAALIFYLFKKGKLSTTSGLSNFATDLTSQAKQKSLDPVIGRDEEIERLIQILCRRTKNNAILLGLPGVGKTAIVEGLARKIASGKIPKLLANKKVLMLQVSELLAGTKYRGEFEQRIKGIVKELQANKRRIILFIDEFHSVTETKGTEGGVNLADILKPGLARGDLQLIGATTKKEYEKYIAPDESWERRFQIVLVDEPTIEESIQILNGIKKNYEKYHKVKISNAAINASVRLSHEYIKERHLPDKAIDVMDEAASMVNVERCSLHAVVVLHGAAKNASQQKEKTPIVELDHVKEVIADWTRMKKKDIH